MNLAIPAPSFNCAAKFLRLPGSIWRESKTIPKAWQGVSRRFSVETCARLCKNWRGHAGVPCSCCFRSSRLRQPDLKGVDLLNAEILHIEPRAIRSQPTPGPGKTAGMAVEVRNTEESLRVRFANPNPPAGRLVGQEIVEIQEIAVARPRRIRDIAALPQPFGPLLRMEIVQHQGAGIPG